MARAVIIGAGPAGSAVAMLLARAGWEVVLVEQHRFPRDKVCGECLSPLALEVLDRLDLTDALRTLNPVRLSRAALVAADGGEASFALSAAMWGLSRTALDSAMLDHARRAGARVRQPSRCESVDAERRAVTIRDLRSNQLERLDFDYLLLADGKGAFAADRPLPTTDFGLKAHFQGARDRDDTIALFSQHGHYCGLAPIEGGRWNLAMSVQAARVRDSAGDFDALLARMLCENAGLRRRLSKAVRASAWLASPLPRFAVRKDWPGRVIPLGNAAAALEPIGGEGMGLAMRSAELAGQMLTGGAFDAGRLAAQFDRLWRTRSLVCRLGALAMSRPELAEAAAPLIDANPRLAAGILNLSGKPPRAFSVQS